MQIQVGYTRAPSAAQLSQCRCGSRVHLIDFRIFVSSPLATPAGRAADIAVTYASLVAMESFRYSVPDLDSSPGCESNLKLCRLAGADQILRRCGCGAEGQVDCVLHTHGIEIVVERYGELPLLLIAL